MRVASTNVAKPDMSMELTRDRSTSISFGLSLKAVSSLFRIALELSMLIRPSNEICCGANLFMHSTHRNSLLAQLGMVSANLWPKTHEKSWLYRDW
jgi:hypothetical protein